jgi:hypothetical protein
MRRIDENGSFTFIKKPQYMGLFTAFFNRDNKGISDYIPLKIEDSVFVLLT